MTDTVVALESKHYWLIALGAVVTWVAVLLAASNPVDFMSFYAAGNLLLRHPHSLYSVKAQWEAQNAVVGGLLPWAHPAPEALLFAPLTLLSYHRAFAVWNVISISMFVVSGWLLRDEILGLTTGGRWALLAFSYYPISNGLLVGQDHGLFLLLWVLAYRSWKAGDEFASGLWIGLSLIRYQFAVPMLLFFVAVRAWKLLRGVAVSSCALLAASFLIVGPGLIPSYLGVVRCLALVSDTGALRSLPTIRGFAALVLPSHCGVAAAICAFCLLAWALATVRGMSRPNAFCFAMVISLLVDPHAYLYELTVLSIPFMLFLKKCPSSALLAFIIFALSFALDVTRTDLFSVLCVVLLVWATWMNRVFRQRLDSHESVAFGVRAESR